jgi:hypothetical protein
VADGGEYGRRREGEGERQRKLSASTRDIGAIPNIANVRRRAKCRKSLRLFCETYNPGIKWDWSADHLKVIARLEEAVHLGAMQALAEPRGWGKTALCRMAALWALSYRHRRYPFVIGATDQKAREAVEFIQKLIRFTVPYSLDFPEISHPANRLAGIANRAAGQTCNGESTLIKWSADRIVLPRVPPPANWPRSWPKGEGGVVPTSGSVVGASGLTGEGIRGSVETLATGEMVRPDLVLLDDPQTRESAESLTQNEKRLRLVMGDVLGMAGPGAKLSAVMPCTVIEPGDMIDQLLDRQKHPLWRGERAGILRSMPADMAAWDAYFEVYARCALKEPPDFAEANAYYLLHRAVLDAGAEAQWASRKAADEVSAVQHAMHLYYRDPAAFWAEGMNRPRVRETAAAAGLTAEGLAGQVSTLGRGLVPRTATRLTAFVDVGADLLWWMVCAFDERFGGHAVSYGVYPEQARPHFAKADPRPGLRALHPTVSEDAALYAGLKAVAEVVCGTTWRQEETGAAVKVERCGVDANWGEKTALVYEFCRRSPYAAVLLPAHGKFVGPQHAPMSSWKLAAAERPGPGWVLKSGGGGRHLVVDVNQWKSFVADRLRTPEGGAGRWTVHAPGPVGHQLLFDHLAAEHPTAIQVKDTGRQVDVWTRAPNRDNDWFDCLVGCAVAASERGLRWSAGAAAGEAERSPAPRKRVKWSEKYAAKLRG